MLPQREVLDCNQGDKRMGVLHPDPKEINPEYDFETYRLRDVISRRDKADANRALKAMQQAIAGKGIYDDCDIVEAVFDICREIDPDIVYQAVGMRLYRNLVDKGEIDIPWWDAFIPVIHRRMMDGLLWGGVKPDDPSPIRDLFNKAQKAATTEEAADLIRSIAPKGVAVLSET